MHPISPFSVNCPTQIRFGAGSSGALGGVLSDVQTPIVLVQGAGGVQSAGILSALQKDGHDVRIVRQTYEPSIKSIHSALDTVSGLNIGAVIACGGGSVLDAGKTLAVLLEHDVRLPVDFTQIAPDVLGTRVSVQSIAVPTTAGTGAEVTANAVLAVPSKGAKLSIRGQALFPDVALVDPELMQGAPSGVTLHSGLDAVTQVIESYTSSAATPFSDALTLPAIGAGLRALRQIMDHGDASAWPHMAWTSLASGLALANSGLGAAHGLASVIGGQFDAPHGALCGRFLVPVLRENLLIAPVGEAVHARLSLCCTRIAEAFPPTSGTDPLSGLETWLSTKELPRLRAWGIEESDLDRLATLSAEASSSKKNAVPLAPRSFANILFQSL